MVSLVRHASSCVLWVVAFHGWVQSVVVDPPVRTYHLAIHSVCGSIILTTRLSFPGRIEIHISLILYILTILFQLPITGPVLEQGTKPFAVLTAIQARLVVALFWGLLANALVATQVVEYGTVSSLVVSTYPCSLVFVDES